MTVKMKAVFMKGKLRPYCHLVFAQIITQSNHWKFQICSRSRFIGVDWSLIFETILPKLTVSGPEVIKLFSCSTQLSMKFSPLIDVKMPTIVGILTCMSGKNSILGFTEP